jgi:hypothetical protein
MAPMAPSGPLVRWTRPRKLAMAKTTAPVREQCTTSTPLIVQPAARAKGSRP